MPRVYVAGKFGSTKPKDIIRSLEDQGHFVTYDWTGEAIPKPFLGDAQAPYSAAAAHRMVQAVRKSDALLLLSDNRAFGAMVEFGAALAYGIPVLIVLPHDGRQSVFMAHPLVRVISMRQFEVAQVKELGLYHLINSAVSRSIVTPSEMALNA